MTDGDSLVVLSISGFPDFWIVVDVAIDDKVEVWIVVWIVDENVRSAVVIVDVDALVWTTVVIAPAVIIELREDLIELLVWTVVLVESVTENDVLVESVTELLVWVEI